MKIMAFGPMTSWQIDWATMETVTDFILPQFIVIHTVKSFGIVNKAEIDVFLELSCFFYDPVDVGSLISGSFAFSKSNLNIWKFTVNIAEAWLEFQALLY